jgi:hypothetical protein
MGEAKALTSKDAEERSKKMLSALSSTFISLKELGGSREYEITAKMSCGHTSTLSYVQLLDAHSRKRRENQWLPLLCPSCAQRGGFRDSEPGYVYFIAKPEVNLFKVGIAGNNTRADRLKGWTSRGWTAIARFDFTIGKNARQTETLFFHWLKSSGIHARLKVTKTHGRSGAYDGWTETFEIAEAIEKFGGFEASQKTVTQTLDSLTKQNDGVRSYFTPIKPSDLSR